MLPTLNRWRRGEENQGHGSSPSLNTPSKRPKVSKDHVAPDSGAASQGPTPPVFIRKLRKAAVGTGCDIRLRVSVAGSPKPSLTWYHNNELLPPSEAQDSGGLWIRDCHTSDAGLYTCVATNELGEESCSAVLAIMDLGEDRRATLPGAYDPVVERELRTLGSRPPGPHLDPTNPARQALGGGPAEGAPPVRHLGVEPLIRASHANLARPVQGSEESVSVGSDYYGSMFSLYRGRTFSISNFTPPFPLNPHPSRTQTADESQGLSSHVPLSSPQPPPTTHKNSISTPNQDLDNTKPSDPWSSKTDQSSTVNSVTMTPKLARAGPKIFDTVRAFEERRASVDLPGGARSVSGLGRAASFDSDDSRKKTGGPSNEEGRILHGAAQKRAAFKQRASSLEDKTSYSQRVQSYQSKFAEELQRIKKLVGKPIHSSPAADKDTLVATSHKSSLSSRDLGTDSKRDTKMDNKADHRSPSPNGKRASPVIVREPGSQYPPKPPRLTPSPTPSISPLLKRRKAEVGRTSPALKVNIPTILVEDEPMETECDADRSNEESKTRRKEGRVHKSKRGRSAQPRSPEEGGSSDDSYLSADEEPAEGPRFERPLEDTTAPCGSEVTLKCIITGSPPPTVTWRKNNVEIRSDAFQVVKAEGERHSLAIKQMRLNNAGSYCVTAVNTAGRASCSAMLYIQSGESRPEMEGSQHAKGFAFRFVTVTHLKVYNTNLNEDRDVAPCDQGITEGQDVVISAKVRGQPKPMVYWLKDRVTVKTAGRFAVRETDDGVSEMRISSAQRSDAGLYVCKVINEYGTKQAECRVEVIAAAAQAALKITREVKDVGVRAGESAMFECYIIGPPDMDVDWLSNGKLIQPALLNCKMHFDGKRCRLLLNSVHEDDSGTYTCKLSTAKEELTSSANLRVTPSKEPLFTRKLDILEVIEGRTARFDCKVSGSPAPRVTWMHFETRVEESDNVRILQEGGRHSLVITHVSSDTEGFYTAVAQNIHGKAECTAELYMQEPRTLNPSLLPSSRAKLEKMPSIPEEPELLESEVEKRTMPDFVKPLADVEVIEGKEAVLKCKVAGLPYPTIAWYHNGKRIESSEERKMTQYRDVHNLVIRSACHAHGGVYKAVISNKVGKAACYAHLYVTDIVPDPPDGPPVIEAITGKTITLSWKRPKRLDPSFDASSLLYVVQQQPLGSIQWSVVASSLKEPNYTVTSLSKGVRYAFRVLTSTGKTLSKPSPSTDLVQLLDRGPYLRKAPVILDKPDVVYVVENQPASITITLNHVHAVITWKRRGVVLVNRPGMYEMSMPDDDQHTLKLQRVKSTDIGQLVVTASNQFGSDLCTLQLAMAVPPKFETIMEDVDVHIGETSRLAVVVEGKPDPDILWYKDDVLLSESSHFTFVYDDPEYSLVVLNACPEHSGVYTCTAKNLAGSNSCKAELTVHTEVAEPMEDEGTILRKMRRLTDYYDIHKELGRGAFAYVKRVTQKKGKTEFAAKFISARGKRKAFALREMDLLSELDNERILYFHDAFEKKDVVVLITELCHEEFLERMARKTTVMELEIRCSVQQILEGLRYLHQKNIAHLDIKPENILMASPGSDQIRICDFGNAIKLEASEEYYCKYGTPEYVAPEIVNQTPVSTATDIWPVCVITYLCLTGVSPFAGENDRATALNIRNYNVAFEESMFSDLCKEAKGFVIKLLVVDRLRPSAIECLRHPWFKVSYHSENINKHLMLSFMAFLQRSLISYKAKMVMRSIPELLNDSSSHVSIAVARHLKEGSPQLSSSSDSDADVDELPFIPMPLSMVFSGSRVSLNEIPGDEDVSGWPSVAADGTRKNMEVTSTRGRASKRLKDEEDIPNGEKIEKTKRVPLKKGSSVESDESETKARRATMRRGSSADSALLLHIDPEEKNANEDSEASSKSLKKAVSMELPNRSPSPGAAKLSQEDYALKLELMRQRLLRGGSMDKKMSGLRGPLQTGAASSESAGEDVPKTKVFCKSASFTQGDSEPMPLHRRFGAPLEIPSVGNGSMEGKKLQEATSMSALTEQTTLESTSSSPTERTSFILPTPGVDQQRKQNNVTEYEDIDGKTETRTKTQLDEADRVDSESRSPSVITPIIVIEEEDDEVEREENQELHINEKDVKEDENAPQNSKPSSAFIQPKDPSAAAKPSDAKGTDTPTLPEHPAVFAKVATADRSPGSVTSSNPDLPATPRQPVLRTDIKDIDSEEVFEARFKKRESSLTRGLRKLTRNKSEEKSPVLSRKAIEGGEEVYRPGPRGAPLEMVSKGLQEKSKSVQDLREEDKETGFGLIGRLSLRAKRSTSKEQRKAEESSVSAMRHSPVLAMRQKFENKVAGISTKIRSQSEERKADEEGKRTPLFTRHRHSQSEGRGLKGMGIPENQLAKQTISGASKESVESTSSIHSEKASESDRRSRWDRWGLTRSKRDKTPSQSDLPASVPKEEGLSKGQQFIRSASDFAPVFHIKLKDHILLEGEPVTLSCLPAGSPHPEITWMKDRKPLQVDDRISLVSHPDGRQLLMIMKSTWRDAGIYECVAANPIATITTSCTLSIACVPKRPGTPEVPQTYSDTALVLWKPADTKSPCSYTLERKTEGDSNWLTVATGVVDCYYNVTNLPAGGTYRFRVCCVNKAGQGPYSNYSAPVHLDSTDSASPAAFLPPTTSPTKMVVSPTSFLPSSPTTNPPSPSAGMTTEEAQKTGSSLSSSPTVKAPPPFVLPKPQSPVNVVTPMTQTPPISPPPPLVTPPPTPTKPAVASVPTYVPTTTVTARVAPTPVSFSPPVLQTSSLSPIGEGASTPTRGTPSGRATPSTTLRQGVPQKPYTFLDEKARGRFGVIRECRENGTGKIYMAKIIPYSQENKQEVLKEYEILKSLHNEKVMALHEAYVTPRYLVLVAEYCTGKELLYSLIDRFRYSEDDVVGYLVQILQGVEYLHSRRVLHLDLKADNIMVTNLNAIKIVDFGSAQSFNPLSLKHQDSGAGTLEYMAPEMVKGEVVGPPADIWTVGVVTYIMLSGRLPFEDKDPLQVESKILMAKFDPTKLYPNVSQSASAFLKKMLSSYPWARPTTRDCFTHAWLQDSYLMKLRRQTLTFTSSRLKEFLVEQQCRRTEGATKHKVLLRTYQSSPQSPASGTAPHVPSPK
uniref:Striated muscle enriched protein kinase a n=1 Tax=Lates calcarifer TaxID=8187 RepID=A0A4W6F3J7_LATCA